MPHKMRASKQLILTHIGEGHFIYTILIPKLYQNDVTIGDPFEYIDWKCTCKIWEVAYTMLKNTCLLDGNGSYV